MKLSRSLTAALAPLVVLLTAGAVDQTQAAAQSSPVSNQGAIPDEPPGPVIDREADRLLRAMSAALTGTQRFALEAEEVFDEIPDVGPRRSLSNVRRIAIERPNRAIADVTGEAANRTVWFDGGHLTVLDKEHNAYAALDAPKTIHEMLDWAADEYGIDVPLSDLFYPDLYAVLTRGVIRGEYHGLQTVEGTPCHHLAFEQETIDWQIWIDAGTSPVPRKMTIAYKTEVGEPQYTVFIRSWNLHPTFPVEMFRFEPPEGASEMQIDKVLDPDLATTSDDSPPVDVSADEPKPGAAEARPKLEDQR
jgi:hypothetical protein